MTDSGHGYQGLWSLKTLVSTDKPKEQEAFEQYLRRLCQALGGDPTVCETARVLRVAGTYNTKDPQQPVLARLLVAEPERRYTLADFDAVLSSPQTTAQPSNGNPPGWVAEVLQQLHTGDRGDCHHVFGKLIGRLIHDG